MAVSFEQFSQQLTASGLWDEARLSALLDEIPAERKADGEVLARELVKRKHLTAFQAQQIYSGKGKGLVLGNYVILDKLGQGGMGMVLKAEHRRLKRLVALKVLSPAVTKTPAAVQRFQREVEAAAKLRHPNVVATDDADEHKGTHFLVMEYIEGSDLSALVKKQGALSVERAVEYIIQAARGLQYAHENGVIHRDIKPANLLVDGKGTVKILDMGLARIEGAEPGANAELTASGAVMGTVDYMAPEQALNTKTADARSDIYSLGISLWYVLTGKAAYDGESMVAKLLAHQGAPIPSLTSFRPDVPASVDAVFQKMVAKKPEDRPQTMKDVIAALEKCQAGGLATSAGDSQTIAGGPSDNSLISGFLKGMADTAAGVRGTSAMAVIGKPATPSETADLQTSVGQLSDVATHSQLQGVRRSPSAKSAWWRDRRVQIGGGLAGALLLLLSLSAFTGKKGSKAKVEVPTSSNNNTPNPGVTQATTTTGWHGWPADAPKPAIAPFDPAQAKQHQDEWAAYLKVPVEYTNSIGMKFRLIPPGEFAMGSTAEEIAAALKDCLRDDKLWPERIKSEAPQHKVILTQPIYLGVNEVTQAEYEKVMGVNPSHFAPMGMGKEAVAGLETAKHPVEMVSWNDAAEFCTKLSNQEKLKPFYFRAGDTITPLDGTGYRLPSEAEWEFACRAGTTTKYWIGDNDEDLVQAGWFVGNSGGRTHAAGEPKANPFGLADIHGNVLEWVQDGWDATYYGQFQEKPSINPNSPFSTGSQRVIRGGSWYKTASRCRSSYRDAVVPTYLNHFIGFRAALTVDEVKGMQAKGNSAGAAIGSASKIPPDLTPPAPLGTWKAGTPAAWLTQDYRHDGPVMGGLIDTPRAIPGVKRWNVDTAWTRGEIREVRFSPDGKWVALGCTDGHVRILDATTMKLVSLLTGVGGQGGDMGLDWHPDSQQLAVCVAGQVRILSRDGQSSRALPISSGFYPTSVVWNHAGTRLAMGRGSGEFALEIRAADGTLVSQVSDEDRTFTQVCEPCWTADDRHVFCLGGKRCAKIDAETGQAIWTVDDLAPNFAGPLSLSSDGWLAVGDGGNVRLYDPERRLARTLATPGLATIAWHPDGKRLFAGWSLWDRDTGKQIVDTGFRAISAAWSPDGLRLLASQFAELREFTSTGESSGRLSGLDGNHVPISSLRWSPDGRRLAGRGGVFSPRERQILASDQGLSVSIQPPLFASMSVEWLPNSSATFAVGRERDNPTAALRLWAIQPDGVARTLWTPEKPLNSLSWSTCGVSPDGKFLAISLPGAIQILDPSGTPLQTIPTGGDAHPFPSWNPYTGELAILQENEPLRIADPTRNWDIRTAASPLRFTFNTSAPLPHWSPDGKWLAIERFGLFDTEGRPAPDNASKDQVATWRADSAEYVWAGGQQTLFDIHSADGSRKRYRIVNNGLVCAAWHPRGHLIATGSYASVLTAWRTFDLLPHWTMVLLPNDQSATFSGAGELLHPDPAAFDDLLVYTVEREDGSTVNLTPSQFTKFVAEADAPK